MADGFSYEGYTGPPIPFCHSALHSPSASPFPATYPLNLTRGVFDPMISHGPYRRSLSDRFYTPPYGATSLPEPPPPSSLHVNNSRPGNFDHHRGEDSYTNMLPPQSRLYTPRGTSSDSLLERQRLNQIQIPCGVYDSSGIAFDEKRHGQYYDGYDECVNTVFDKSQTSHASLHRSSSVEPVNFNVLLGYGEATGNNVKPLSANPNLLNGTAGSTSSSVLKEKQEGSGVSSLYHTPKTWVAGSENGGVSETSLKNVIDGLKRDEHRSWNHFMVSSEGPSAPTMFPMRSSESCVAVKADNSVNQPIEDVQASEKTCKLQEQTFDMMSRDKKTDMGIIGSSKGDLPSTVSSTRVSSVVDAMHNLSEVLVYECFSNGSGLKPEQIENLDKVVENLTKCLKKITGNKTVTGEETSIPSQAVHVSCPNVGDLNEPLDNFGLTEPVDKDKYEDEMTQGIKNILASNFPDGEENHPQTLLYKSLWLETEAALCSTTCMNRYNRIKKEIDNLKLQNREFSADASTFMQEPFRNTQKPVSVMNNVEQETTDSLIKHGRSITGNDTVTKSHDAPRSSRFNSDPVNAVLSLMSRSFMGGLAQEDHQNFTPNAATFGKIPDAIQQETHNDVTDRFQILKQQETKRKLKSQKCDQEENPEASKVANIGRSSQMSDVMDRFKILKRREAGKVQRSLNSLDTDSDSDKPRNETQICDRLWSNSIMTIGGTSVIETCAGNTEEPSASGEGCESPTSDWEHVRKDN